jgi:hypothetical protein
VVLIGGEQCQVQHLVNDFHLVVGVYRAEPLERFSWVQAGSMLSQMKRQPGGKGHPLKGGVVQRFAPQPNVSAACLSVLASSPSS